ncbi:MAG TPA: SRPBCC domain-containing protein [bacterium]|jgi:uncharacterized protein YndB with AHSA1/START domain|nr:SRPBCC domain-containing protein [bacterium]
MSQPDYVYISYLRATPNQVFKALTDPQYTKQYFFGVSFDTDWKPGSKIHVPGPDGKHVLWGRVLKVEEPRLLSYTFDGPAHGTTEDAWPTTATFEIHSHGEGTRLYLTHSGLKPGDLDPRKDTFHGLNNGWPAILSSLKSLLETGKALTLRPGDTKGDYV